MPTIYLYAEVLANIRQANLYASLQTHKNEHTRIDIASDKKTVTVSHDGQTACIYLPTEIRGTAEVNIPIERGKEMSVRLELADITTMPSAKDAVGNEGPWLATDLSSEADIRCRLCTTEVRQKGMPLDFKDLPSQHWAEMMDFWHCHRPHDATVGSDEDAKLAADYKGYGSSTKLKAAPGIAFVDTMSFLLDATSCRNIQVGNLFLLSAAWLVTCITKIIVYNPMDFVDLGNKKGTSSNPETVLCSGRRYTCPKSNIWLISRLAASSARADGYSCHSESPSLESFSVISP